MRIPIAIDALTEGILVQRIKQCRENNIPALLSWQKGSYCTARKYIRWCNYEYLRTVQSDIEIVMVRNPADEVLFRIIAADIVL